MDKYYEFQTVWRLSASIDSIWAEFEDSESWPKWWKGVLSIRELKAGDDTGVGKIVRSTWKSILPYKLIFDAEIVRVDRKRQITAKAFGELEGTGTWHFIKEGDRQTCVHYVWCVKTTKTWMNMLAPIARPFFLWNHHTIMGWGGIGLAKRLGCALMENKRVFVQVRSL